MATTASAERTVSEVGKRLSQTRLNKDALVKLLKQAADALSEFLQSPSLQSALEPIYDSIVRHNYLRHKDKDVKLLVAVCFSEIIRILAPDPPFSDALLKDIFKLFIGTFGELADTASPYFTRRVKILETVARVRCCVLMLDIGCNDLVLDMFNVFFSVIRDEHPQILFQGILSIMTLILEEEVTQPLLDVILQNLLKDEKNVSPASYRLAVSVIQNCMEKLEPFVRRFLTSSIIDRGARGSELGEVYHEIIFEIFQCAPQMLLAVIPNLTQELLIDQVDVRMKAVQLLGRLFSLPGCQAAHEYHQLFVEFLKRFSDKSVEVRLSALECAKGCYMANPSGVEALDILGALEARLLDFDEKVRVQVVNIICDLAQCHPRCIPSELVLRAAERLRDKKVSVRKNTMQRLLELYTSYCNRCFEGEITPDDNFEQIPSRILRLCYDKDSKDFKPQNVELVLAENLFPASLPVAERVRHWISFFSFFNSPHIKALESILSQKWRLQMGMQEYLALRQKGKDGNSDAVHKEVLACFRKMSTSFADPVKAQENFQNLHQMKDNSIFKTLLSLLDEQKDVEAAQTIRDDLLKRIGSRHPQYEFLRILSAKCSNTLFNAEHVNLIILYCLSNNAQAKALVASAIDLLWTVVNICPSILKGSEEGFVKLLMEKLCPFEDKLLQTLARAGSHISIAFPSIFPFLEQQCLEGTRSRAKHSLPAIVALTDASCEPALSDLFRKLVDSLFAGRNVPTVLQSLSTLAQHRVSMYETCDEEITQHIIQKIFRVSNSDWHDHLDEGSSCTYNCKLKVYALKALVKSFLPLEGTRSRQKLGRLFGILLKLMLVGEISDGINSSENDKAHLRLAAAVSVLRLARKWDAQVSPQLFHVVIQRARDHSDLVRHCFVDKINKFLRSRSLPRKYACAFAVAACVCHDNFQEDCVRYLTGFIEDYRQEARNRQASSHNSDGVTMTYYPEYVLPYLIHVLAHDPLFPDMDCQDSAGFVTVCSPLFILLKALIISGPTDDIKRESSESISFTLGILRAIKMSEDAVDEKKSNNLHVLADVGLIFTKSLGGSNQLPSQVLGKVLLPSSFYRVRPDAKSRRADDNCLPDCIANGSFLEKVQSVWSHIFQLSGKRGKRLQEEVLHVEDKSSGKLVTEKHSSHKISGGDNMADLSDGNGKASSKTFRSEGSSRCKAKSVLPSKTTSSQMSSHENSTSSDGALRDIVPGSRKEKNTSSAADMISKRLRSSSGKGTVGSNGICHNDNKRSHDVGAKLLNNSHCNVGEALIGQRIKIWSPFDNCFCPGTVCEYNPDNCSYMIEYDNGDIERLCLTNERWEAVSMEPASEKEPEEPHLENLQDKGRAEADPSPSHDIWWGSSLSNDTGPQDSDVIEDKSAEDLSSSVPSDVEGDLDSRTLSSFIGKRKAVKKTQLKPSDDSDQANVKRTRLEPANRH
ncbi:sister chromatid cohesion protein PDS5 homolog B isoform X2 [Nymphaea colorata]|uniref:sister chromatid cohesion protein PDS5 homolog B isoform X2 n=1 Tax=Nymphaea colorata TaxID=210225 RepID=UPI00129E5E23|nr:sister chromatid cohesion protein PDS5 homolog B isoform X2 [Nymphaea colorata]